jgi:hypothetical protein
MTRRIKKEMSSGTRGELTEARKDNCNDFHDEGLALPLQDQFVVVVECHNKKRKRNTTVSSVEQQASVQQQKKARKETFHDGNDATFLLLDIWLSFYLYLLFSSCWLKQAKHQRVPLCRLRCPM